MKCNRPPCPERRFALSGDLLDSASGGWLPVVWVAASEFMAATALNPASLAGTVGTAAAVAAVAAGRAETHLNPRPGQGRPEDVYVPATLAADGSITPGYFESPLDPYALRPPIAGGPGATALAEASLPAPQAPQVAAVSTEAPSYDEGNYLPQETALVEYQVPAPFDVADTALTEP